MRRVGRRHRRGVVLALAFGLAIAAATVWAIPQAHAGNIISLADNATSCGGSVLCSTNGTTGYNGTQPFDLSTIKNWFQIYASTSMIAGQPAQSMNAGDFLVINDTGAIVTSFSLTITDTFTSLTPSVGACTGAQTGNPVGCDNFQIHGGAANYFSVVTLSGPAWDSCTQGSTVGATCTDDPGGAAANFAPNMVTYTWSAGSDAGIPIDATFDIDFSSWNNAAFATPGTSVAEPSSLALFGAALIGLCAVRCRKRKPA